MHQFDKSSKRLIEHKGDSMLRSAGVRDFTAWKPLPAELVQSRRLPDGVVEVRSPGDAEPDFCILEIAIFPDARVPSLGEPENGRSRRKEHSNRPLRSVSVQQRRKIQVLLR
jgi:hypothetical protein